MKRKKKETKTKKPSKEEVKTAVYDSWKSETSSTYPKRYVVTGFELAHDCSKECVKALRMVARYSQAQMIFTPVNTQVRALESQPDKLYDSLHISQDEIYKQFRFNHNLKLHDARINAQQNDPLTGLVDYGDHVNESIIIGHTKMNMRLQATGTTTHPRMNRSTGVCTLPDYRENRQGQIAKRKHKLGGLFVEVFDEERFLIRELYYKDEEIYLVTRLPKHKYPHVWRFNINYDRPKRSFLAGLVLGDIHVGLHDVQSLEASFEQQWFLEPDYTLFHDFMDFNNPQSHHSINKKSTHINRMSFYDDMLQCQEFFDGFVNQAEQIGSEIVMVPSNHHEHLHKFLESGRFWNTTGKDFLLANELAYKWFNLGQDPLIALLDPDKDKATWLPLDNDFKIHNVHVGNHGHLGLGGSRGTVKQMSNLFRSSVSGHTHSPQTLEDHMTTGTNSLLNMPYSHGQGNTFMASNVGIFPNGTKTQLPIIKGVWYL